MARKKDHSETKIIDACVDLIAKYGKESFSVRNVANHLGSSTQPIYSYFKDSNQLFQKTLTEIGNRLLDQINFPYTEFPFRNMGYGFTLFAKENPNLFSANVKYTYLGGSRTHPIDEDASLQAQEIVEDYTQAFSIQNPTAHVVSVTTTYRINAERVSHLISLQVLNVSGAREYYGYQYNFRNQTIDPNTDQIILPNISYRIEF